MLNGIQTISHTIESIGLLIKSTKINHTWKILINSSETTITLLVSKLTSKLILLLNGVVLFQGKRQLKAFIFNFSHQCHSLTISETGKSFDLYIDGLSFMIMHNRQASITLPASSPQSFVLPTAKVSAFISQTAELAPWELKAHSYRLKFRQIPPNALREKVQIKSSSCVRLDNQFIDESLESEQARKFRNKVRWTSFAVTTRSSNNSKKPKSIDPIMHRRKESMKVMNFFLL